MTAVIWYVYFLQPALWNSLLCLWNLPILIIWLHFKLGFSVATLLDYYYHWVCALLPWKFPWPTTSTLAWWNPITFKLIFHFEIISDFQKHLQEAFNRKFLYTLHAGILPHCFIILSLQPPFYTQLCWSVCNTHTPSTVSRSHDAPLHTVLQHAFPKKQSLFFFLM